jgi:hypothetical protein
VVLLVAILVVTGLGVGAVATNAFGAGDRFEHVLDRLERFLAGPPPRRATLPTVAVSSSALPSPAATPASLAPDATPTPRPTPTPTPARVPVDVDILTDPAADFAHEIRIDWCAPAGTQMVLAIHGKGNTSDDFQRELARRVREWESYDDSYNGEWGPAAMALALDAYGVPGYQIRAYDTRADAMRDSARAISETGAPVILLAWRGAHTWVMTGYRADADPRFFPDASVSGAYVLDPWYPDISSIWGPSDPPGTFQDESEMKRNFLPWKRPEGHYADRDGKFIAVVPTVARPGYVPATEGPAE